MDDEKKKWWDFDYYERGVFGAFNYSGMTGGKGGLISTFWNLGEDGKLWLPSRRSAWSWDFARWHYSLYGMAVHSLMTFYTAFLVTGALWCYWWLITLHVTWAGVDNSASQSAQDNISTWTYLDDLDIQCQLYQNRDMTCLRSEKKSYFCTTL